jgi:hypothetical protein
LYDQIKNKKAFWWGLLIPAIAFVMGFIITHIAGTGPGGFKNVFLFPAIGPVYVFLDLWRKLLPFLLISVALIFSGMYIRKAWPLYLIGLTIISFGWVWLLYAGLMLGATA